MTAVPAPTAVTSPLAFTVTAAVLLDDQVTAWFVAPDGTIAATRDWLLPTVRVREDTLSPTPVTGNVTVTVHVAVLLLSAVVTVMTAVPALTAVTFPLASTAATALLPEVHVTALFVAFEGLMVAVRVSVPLTNRLKVFLLSDTLLTWTLFTVTLHVAVLLPSAVLTVIVAVPAFSPVTSPPELTLATPSLFDVHVTVLLVAFEGLTVAVRVDVLPTFKVIELLLRLTPVTGTVTVTVQVAVLLLSAVVTVIVAVPALTAVTTPSDDTVATLLLLVVQVTALFVAFEGLIVAVRVSLPLTCMSSVVLLSETLLTWTLLTVTVQVAVRPPSTVLTVMTAVPALKPVTSPAELTLATDSLAVDHITAGFVADDGATVALSVEVLPTSRPSVLLFKDTPVTGIGAGVTVTEHVSVRPPSDVVTVMTAVPAATAVTSPSLLTAAAAALLVVQTTAVLLAFDGSTSAVRFSVSPATMFRIFLFRLTLSTGMNVT